MKFTEQNAENKFLFDKENPFGSEHIVERFKQAAEAIRNLDPNKYDFFIWKNTSVDDGIESMFYYYDEDEDYKVRTLQDYIESEHPRFEFIQFVDGKVTFNHLPAIQEYLKSKSQ